MRMRQSWRPSFKQPMRVTTGTQCCPGFPSFFRNNSFPPLCFPSFLTPVTTLFLFLHCRSHLITVPPGSVPRQLLLSGGSSSSGAGAASSVPAGGADIDQDMAMEAQAALEEHKYVIVCTRVPWPQHSPSPCRRREHEERDRSSTAAPSSGTAPATPATSTAAGGSGAPSSDELTEEELLAQALSMSLEVEGSSSGGGPTTPATSTATSTPAAPARPSGPAASSTTSTTPASREVTEADFQDPEYVRSILGDLEGVDLSSPEIQVGPGSRSLFEGGHAPSCWFPCYPFPSVRSQELLASLGQAPPKQDDKKDDSKK